MSYCIAFSADGCQDVTRRYVRSPNENGLPRNKCAEGVLAHILSEIKALRRRDMDKTERFRLVKEDMQEEEYLRALIIEAIAFNVSRIIPSGGSEKSDRQVSRNDPDAQKAAEAQLQQERARARDPRQSQNNHPNQHQRDQHQH
jgi:peptide-N4-(N-acetyl-beta-glucosaminyl)asparagine amidase